MTDADEIEFLVTMRRTAEGGNVTLTKPSRYIDQKEYLTQVQQAIGVLIDTIDQRADLDIGWEEKSAEMLERAEADYGILKNYLR